MDVVLIEPRYPGNIGSAARVMRNLGFSDLVLVDPPEIDEETRKMAKHAMDVVKEARIFDDIGSLPDYDYLVGTTALTGSERDTVPLNEADGIPEDSAILFGNEGTGLSNDVLDDCDLVLRIPTSSDYPTMNLSHAVAVTLYGMRDMEAEREAAGRELRSEILDTFINILEKVGVEGGYREEAFGKMVDRVPPSRQEATALLASLKDIEKEI